MKTRILALTVSLLLLSGSVTSLPVWAARNTDPVQQPNLPRINGIDPKASEYRDLVHSIDDMVKASNAHKIDELLKHYNTAYLSGDNMTLSQLKELILQTWKEYPDIDYKTDLQEIRVQGDWAAVETLDASKATVPGQPGIFEKPGTMSSQSHSTIYFKRNGELGK